MVDGELQYHKEGIYYLRFGADGGKQQFVLAGTEVALTDTISYLA
jgi:hypothetical protein